MLEERVALAVLVPIRVGAGQLVLAQAFQQVAAGWLVQPLFVQKLQAVQNDPHRLAVLGKIGAHVLAHAQLYGVASCTAQIVLGLLLVLGLLGRTAALFLFLGHLCAATLFGVSPFDSATTFLLLSLMSLSLSPCGRVLGLDALLGARLPRFLA